MTHIYVALAFMAVTGLIGFYLGHRGLTGVNNDVQDIKKDIAVLKVRTEPNPTPVPQVIL